MGGARFAGMERIQTIALVYLLGLIGEQHRVTVKGDAQLVGFLSGAAHLRGHDGGRGVAFGEHFAHVLRIGRQKQVGAEGGHIRIRALAASEGGAGDIETVMPD